MAETEYIIVLVTVPNTDSGQQIARMLVEQKLAACVNVVGPLTSIYTWDGEIKQEQEFLLFVKTRKDLFMDRLIPAIRAMHPYQLPEILAVPIEAGLPPYLTWINEMTT